jgi:hypothetical protein
MLMWSFTLCGLVICLVTEKEKLKMKSFEFFYSGKIYLWLAFMGLFPESSEV